MGEELAIVLGFLTGGAFLMSPVMIVRMVIAHRERMAKGQSPPEGTAHLAQEVAALRRELAQVRESATHYDLSFDAALTRVESRLDNLEAPRRTDVRTDSFTFPTRTHESDVAQTLNTRR